MTLELQKATILAENLQGFINLVNKASEDSLYLVTDHDKLYRVRLLVEEFNLQLLSDELHRLIRFVWDPKPTLMIIDRIKEKLTILDEYIQNNYQDLFLLSGRVYSMKCIVDSF